MARKRNRKSVRGKAHRRARKKVPIGVLLWTAIILFVLVVFLFNRVAIRDVMDRTDLLTVLQRSVDNAMGGNTPAAGEVVLPEMTRNPVAPAATRDAVAQPEPRQPQPLSVTQPEEVAADPAPVRADELPVAAPAAPRGVSAQAAEATPANEPAQPNASPPPRAPGARQRRLFFAAVSDAGDIAVTGVMRAVDDTASPLTETLRTLFAGPGPSEIDQGLITMIPPAVTLNRVYVSERIAYIDVSESFRFNPLGREGLDAQLRQIVFSATEFPGVEMVQILIDGRRVEFLGPEGTYIGKPIGRAMFPDAPAAAP